MRKPWILGLTGGIGSGKSAVAQCFIERGVHLVDADHAARWVVEPGKPALARIVEHFGPTVLQADGQLDRAALRRLIFENAEERRWLESRGEAARSASGCGTGRTAVAAHYAARQ